MPVIDSNGCPIDVEVTGPADAPVLMLSSSLGTTKHMWDPQMPAFTAKYRVVRYDRRGHGKSGVSKGPYSMEMLGRDALAVMDALKLDKVNWLGLSMGGMEGMWLGANAPGRIDKLILSNTNGHVADKTPWIDRIKFVREKSLADLVGPNMERWFTKGFRDKHPEVIARFTEMFLATDKVGYIASCEAIRDLDFRATNPTIKAPTLVIVGKSDPATPPSAGEAVAAAIPGAKVIGLDAAHIANIEQPALYTKTVLDFLRS
jgi:3-oxoadipate enol-lactonase